MAKEKRLLRVVYLNSYRNENSISFDLDKCDEFHGADNSFLYVSHDKPPKFAILPWKRLDPAGPANLVDAMAALFWFNQQIGEVPPEVKAQANREERENRSKHREPTPIDPYAGKWLPSERLTLDGG